MVLVVQCVWMVLVGYLWHNVLHMLLVWCSWGDVLAYVQLKAAPLLCTVYCASAVCFAILAGWADNPLTPHAVLFYRSCTGYDLQQSHLVSQSPSLNYLLHMLHANCLTQKLNMLPYISMLAASLASIP